MANDDRVWRWDDAKAEASTGAEAQARMDALLMKAADTDDPDDAVSVLLGRPRVAEEREETVKIQVRVPRSWQERIDRKADGERLSRSEYLRRIIGRDALQPA
jgi:hypothetical protein